LETILGENAMQKAITAGVLACAMGLSGCASNPARGTFLTTLFVCPLAYALTKDVKAATAICVTTGTVVYFWGKYLNEKEQRELNDASIRAAAEGRTNERVAWGGSQEGTASDQMVHAPAQHRRSKHARHRRPKTPTVQANAAVPSGEIKTASSTPAVNEATGWVVPISDVYVANGKTLRKLHQVAMKNGETHEHDVIAEKTASGWVIPT
jgi:hypothetical protein